MLLKVAYRIGYLRALQDAGIKLGSDDGTPARPVGDQSIGAEQLTKALDDLAQEEMQAVTAPVPVKQLEPEPSKSYFQFTKGRSIGNDTLTNLGIDWRPPMDTGVL